MPEIVTNARALVANIGSAHWSHTFERAVAAFTRLLGTVPDYGPLELTSADIDELRQLAEGVIQLIEVRLEAHHDRESVQRDLADAVYRIRRQLEQIEFWRRHYLAPRT